MLAVCVIGVSVKKGGVAAWLWHTSWTHVPWPPNSPLFPTLQKARVNLLKPKSRSLVLCMLQWLPPLLLMKSRALSVACEALSALARPCFWLISSFTHSASASQPSLHLSGLAWSHLRTFVLTVPSAWNAFLPDFHKPSSLTSSRFLLRYSPIKEAFLTTLYKISTSSFTFSLPCFVVPHSTY